MTQFSPTSPNIHLLDFLFTFHQKIMFSCVKNIMNMKIKASCAKLHTVPKCTLHVFVFHSCLSFSTRNTKLKVREMKRVSNTVCTVVSFSIGINYCLLHFCAQLYIRLYYTYEVHMFAYNYWYSEKKFGSDPSSGTSIDVRIQVIISIKICFKLREIIFRARFTRGSRSSNFVWIHTYKYYLSV